MSIARPVYRNASMMITKRVAKRRYGLRPCRRTNAIVLYIVAVIAKHYQIQLHGLTVMSNHYHATLTDPEGNVCNFTRDCHSFITRALNAEFGEFESLWSSQQTSHVTCVEPSDLVDKMVYSMANPVKAGLVAHGKSWPGIRMAWPAPAVEVRRTGTFFRNADSETWPETAVLELVRPPGYEELDDEELGAMIHEAIEAREAEHRKERYGKGLRFLGRRKVLEQSRDDRPRSHEEHGTISPRVACRNKWLRIERLAQNRAWLEAYQKALKRWRAGDRTVEFPHGTYKMRVVHGARCVGPPS